MVPVVWRYFRAAIACCLVATFSVPRTWAAEQLVTPEELQKAALAVTQARQHDIETIQQFLSSDRAQEALRSAHMNLQQVKQAIPRLSDQELAQLASRASKAQADFAAGRLDNRDLIIILICIAGLILIIVAVR
jgi:CHASE3 domain sensor protein